MSSSPGGTKSLAIGRPVWAGARGSFSASRHGRPHPRGNSATTKTAGQGISGDDRNVVEFPIGHSAPAKDIVPLRKLWRCPNADHAP